MTVDNLSLKVASALASYSARATSSSGNSLPSTSTVAADAATYSAAAATIQEHLSGSIQPPQFSVDYLSGLDVMTVRSANDGKVVFQIPGPAAVRLAQLLKEGTPVESFGLLDHTA